MARFKQVPQNYLLGKLMEYWRNTVRNYNGPVRDDDFFYIVRSRCPQERLAKLVKNAFPQENYEDDGKYSSRRRRRDFADFDDCQLQSLWNAKAKRGKLKSVLEKIYDGIMKDNRCRSRRKEAIEERFGEIRRLLKLSALETDILILAYVKNRTCFEWPVRLEDHEKPLYYAMALDRSFAEVSGAMTAKGNLRKFGLLDDEGKRTFFERMFKTTLTEEEYDALKALRNLAPGDFRTVRQERFYLAGKNTNMDCIEALGEECALKKDGGRAPIGFAA